MKWFIVKYLYQIVIGEQKQHGQFDEQTRLIIAFDRAEALQKAEQIAGSFHEPFENCSGERVHWKFICIESLREIDPPYDGQELCSALHEPADVNGFLDLAYKHKKYLEMELMDCSVPS